MDKINTPLKNHNSTRRKLLHVGWTAPIIYTIALPTHAQTSATPTPTPMPTAEINDDAFIQNLRTPIVGNVLDNDVNLVQPVSVTLLSGNLPSGITLATNGDLNGTPSATGIFVSVYQVTDASGVAGTAQLTITVQ